MGEQEALASCLDPRRAKGSAVFVDDPSWRAAFAALAYQALDSAGDEVPHEARVLLAQNWVGTLLDVGLTGKALAALDSLPDSTRDAVLRESDAEVTATIDGLLLTGELEDVRLDAGAAFAIEGDPDRAAQLLQHLEVPLNRTVPARKPADERCRSTFSSAI